MQREGLIQVASRLMDVGDLALGDRSRADVTQLLEHQQGLLVQREGLIQVAPRLMDVGDLAVGDRSRADVTQLLEHQQAFLVQREGLIQVAPRLMDVGDLAVGDRSLPDVTQLLEHRQGCFEVGECCLGLAALGQSVSFGNTELRAVGVVCGVRGQASGKKSLFALGLAESPSGFGESSHQHQIEVILYLWVRDAAGCATQAQGETGGRCGAHIVVQQVQGGERCGLGISGLNGADRDLGGQDRSGIVWPAVGAIEPLGS